MFIANLELFFGGHEPSDRREGLKDLCLKDICKMKLEELQKNWYIPEKGEVISSESSGPFLGRILVYVDL